MTAFHTTRQLVLRTLAASFLIATLCVQALDVHAGAREQAKRIHDRIAGVPPSAEVLNDMESLIVGGDAVGAAQLALDDPAFYDVTLKNFVAPWTNEAMSPFVPLNDYTATVIGIVRDGRDFREILTGDIVYVGDSSLGLSPYNVSNNDHYEELEARVNGSDVSLSNPDHLVETQQSLVNGGELPSTATAGVMTTRAAAQAFFSAGTNRAMFRFTLLNHMCNDLEQVADVSLPPDRIRQDVSRSPGGDSRVFLNNCVGCHTGMDPMAQAFAYYDYEYDGNIETGRLIYNAAGETNDTSQVSNTRVMPKYHINGTTFEQGYLTPDDSWDNYWRSGANRRLGWDSGLPGSGNGAKSLGREFANSDAFAQCQVKKVFRNVCLREPGDSDDRAAVSNIVTVFKNGYDLKDVFAETAAYCKGA
ncbi:hypothetical protein [Marinobacter sp. CHS3-4]|uniref:hypothetical protein n=1 Tax=Marinobacter sp. CHS3-4 TaxID=3045174 RepID=UPI0024B49D23|nr:hypothetical protein [Marinobacter sp. CHS3-4]MDI9245748.1 hypothetical protein [Marinobacter sp. CHS3-4]